MTNLIKPVGYVCSKGHHFLPSDANKNPVRCWIKRCNALALPIEIDNDNDL